MCQWALNYFPRAWESGTGGLPRGEDSGCGHTPYLSVNTVSSLAISMYGLDASCTGTSVNPVKLWRLHVSVRPKIREPRSRLGLKRFINTVSPGVSR